MSTSNFLKKANLRDGVYMRLSNLSNQEFDDTFLEKLINQIEYQLFQQFATDLIYRIDLFGLEELYD